jgi:hypothetical protein
VSSFQGRLELASRAASDSRVHLPAPTRIGFRSQVGPELCRNRHGNRTDQDLSAGNGDRIGTDGYADLVFEIVKEINGSPDVLRFGKFDGDAPGQSPGNWIACSSFFSDFSSPTI